jgi:hypothetical protein
MNESLVTWNFPNTVTITLIALVGYFVLVTGAKLVMGKGLFSKKG